MAHTWRRWSTFRQGPAHPERFAWLQRLARDPEALVTLKMLQYLPKSLLAVYALVSRKSFLSSDFFTKGLAGASSKPFGRFPVIVIYKHSNNSTMSVILGYFSGTFFFYWARWTFCSVECAGSLIGAWWICCGYGRMQTWLHIRPDAASGSWAKICKQIFLAKWKSRLAPRIEQWGPDLNFTAKDYSWRDEKQRHLKITSGYVCVTNFLIIWKDTAKISPFSSLHSGFLFLAYFTLTFSASRFPLHSCWCLGHRLGKPRATVEQCCGIPALEDSRSQGWKKYLAWFKHWKKIHILIACLLMGRTKNSSPLISLQYIAMWFQQWVA